MPNPVNFTTVTVNVNGTKKEIKMQDGITLKDQKTETQYTLLNGKWYKADGLGLRENRGFLGIRNVQPKINMTMAQMQCIQALMNNDGEYGLSVNDINIGRSQFDRGELGKDFAEFLTNDKVKPARYSDKYGNAGGSLYVGLADKRSGNNSGEFYISTKHNGRKVK